MLWMDAYTRKARLRPPLLVAMPLAITVTVLYPAGLTPATAAWGLLTWAGATYLIAQFGGERGKKFEPWLFELWGGKPTTARLRHRDSTNATLLTIYHRRLAPLMADQRFPTAAEEAANPDTADRVYDAAVALLRQRTRDHKAFGLVFEHLCNYGFRRNLWGLKPVGLVLTSASLALIPVTVLVSDRWSFEISSPALGTAVVVNVLFLVAWLWVTPNWVKRSADNYADALVETCQSPAGL